MNLAGVDILLVFALCCAQLSIFQLEQQEPLVPGGSLVVRSLTKKLRPIPILGGFANEEGKVLCELERFRCCVLGCSRKPAKYHLLGLGAD